MGELLFLPALLAYGEAAVAYAGEARRPGRAAGFATWGVRLGWLAQTAIITVQAVGSASFPWQTWAASLNLFVWLVVGVYLVWGCRARFRLLGVAVMPFAAGLLLTAWLAGAAEEGDPRYPTLFLVFHVGLVLAAFAGFTLAAAMSALYLFEERRLKRRRPGTLLGRAPSLLVLDTLAGRTVLVSLLALAVGVALGLKRLGEEGAPFDPVMAVTLLAALVYGLYLLLRVDGWRGRRAAYLALAGFALVVLVRLALPLAHGS